jgi:glucose-6-phosphate 1-dehydrogenase
VEDQDAHPVVHGSVREVEADTNPLTEGLERLPVPHTTLVIFGATGDLARRKLLPAIYNLAHEGALPERFNLVGVSRRDLPNDEFRQWARDAIAEFSRRDTDEKVLDGLLEHLQYVGFSFDDTEGYGKLSKVLDELDEEAGLPLNRAFYLSTAPEFFPVVTDELKKAGLNTDREDSEVRIIIEKPFGTDLESARELQDTVSNAFRERQVFRIDHYLGKETVQNLLAFRFANVMFEPLWNRNYIDHVQITAAEELGIGSRAGYYDQAGALRDLVQNHMMQLLTLLCMEPPASFDAKQVRDEKVKVLTAITPPTAEEVPNMTVRAQYTSGNVAGEQVPGYLEEDDVPDDSTTETYTALRLEVHNWRWAGVPIVLRTGKRLARKVTEIVVALKPVPHLALVSEGSVGVQPNRLVLTVQPNEGVTLTLGAKIPGTRMRIRPVNMEFLYGTAFMSQSPEAYERLLMDAMRGDATLFTRNDEALAQWEIIDPILKAWASGDQPVATYEAGSTGPEEADALLGDGREWREL